MTDVFTPPPHPESQVILSTESPAPAAPSAEPVSSWSIESHLNPAPDITIDHGPARHVSARRVPESATPAVAPAAAPQESPANVFTPPPHPESQIMNWSALELEAIRAYGQRCWAAGNNCKRVDVDLEAPVWKHETPTLSAVIAELRRTLQPYFPDA